VPLDDADFALLLQLVLGLHERASKGGWIPFGRLRFSRRDGSTTVGELDHKIKPHLSRLRRPFRHRFPGLLHTDIIQQQAKHVRLSTHRAHVDGKWTRLLGHSHRWVVALAKKLVTITGQAFTERVGGRSAALASGPRPGRPAAWLRGGRRCPPAPRQWSQSSPRGWPDAGHTSRGAGQRIAEPETGGCTTALTNEAARRHRSRHRAARGDCAARLHGGIRTRCGRQAVLRRVIVQGERKEEGNACPLLMSFPR
jgi:hypothetical protein